MLKLNNISKYYSVSNVQLEVLKKINLEIKKGELVAVTGKSGSGKTTLLNILGILDKYEKGEYFFEDKLIKNLSDRDAAYFRNKNIGFVFQSFHLTELPSKIQQIIINTPLRMG